ncbi:Hypothetical protein PMT_2788 [Prochlorococcus marinus str. MIT 9313]|uniref:Uncharacterized protein n=1 Tax=Prochlorococcus marinus (strain MIT 9313) TaxID=74547 RepID=B9ESG1_PROMM|nr:Hypothetical protein PMT_2788 [Prochlorococcus marinus str. MIT 9313]
MLWRKPNRVLAAMIMMLQGAVQSSSVDQQWRCRSCVDGELVFCHQSLLPDRSL